MKRRGSSGDGRRIRETVRGSKKRSESSRRWLERQLNDPYVHRAKAEGYRSRAAFKLVEIDDRHDLLFPGARVVDLGAAPGGWSQVAASRVQSNDDDPLVVAIDLLAMEPIAGVRFMRKDFLDDDAPDLLTAALGGHRADLVISDMAGSATGHKKTDHLQIMYLCEVAHDFARRVLAPGGHFLAKVLQGGTEHTLLAELKRDFAAVGHVKPAASRTDSAELYVLAREFRGTDPSP